MPHHNVFTRIGRLLLLFCLFSGSQALCASISGQVFKVVDGDSVVVLTDAGRHRRVVLAGVAAPPAGTASARDARKQLHMLLAGRFVRVEFAELTPSADILGQIFHGGSDVNRRLIEFGLVRFKPAASLEPETRDRYQQAQDRARRLGLGIWRRNDR